MTHEDWQGEGWYAIEWSDGGMDWTSDGPVWLERPEELADELASAGEWSTDTHLPCARYLGDGDAPVEYETLAYLRAHGQYMAARANR